jgi:hypothetical protein
MSACQRYRGLQVLGLLCSFIGLAQVAGLCDEPIPGAATFDAGVNAILQRVVAPRFPARNVSVTNYGAIADGKTDCTRAFASAIADCAKQGGGRVVVPSGKYRTGPIHLRSNIELFLADDSEIVFSDRFEDYLPPVFVRVGGIELYNYSPLIYARNCTNVAVTGKGRLNGNATAWWPWKSRETKEFFDMAARGVPVDKRVFGTPDAAIRPNFLCLVSCTNVLLEDFTIGSGPNWTIHPVYCQNTTIRGVKIETDGPNNDGIDPDSCRDMLIEDCTFSTGDDCVVLKSGYNEDGWRVARPTENVVMRRCFSKRGHGGLVIGSEMSGDVRNVFLYDCEFDGTDRAIRIKSRRGRGGVVEKIFARNLRVQNMQREVVIMNMDYSSDQKQAANEKPPVFRNMEITDVIAEGTPTAILLQGLEDSPIQNVRFDKMILDCNKGIVCANVSGVMFNEIQVTPARGPAFDLTNSTNTTIRRTKVGRSTDVFLKIAGEHSTGLRIEQSNLSNVTHPVVAEKGASEAAVVIEQ